LRNRRFGGRTRRSTAAVTKPKDTRILPQRSLNIARRALIIISSVLLLASCGNLRQVVDRAALGRQDDGYVRVVLALGVRDPDSLDFYAGSNAWLRTARAAFDPLAQVRADAVALIADIDRTMSSSPAAFSRRAFLKAQLGAVVARVDLLNGQGLTFDEESRRLFGEGTGWRDGDEGPGHNIARIDEMLPGRGSVAERFATLEQRFRVPVEKIQAVFERAVAECREVTQAHVVLPPEEHVAFEYVRGMPWSAFTRYEGRARSLTRVNLDFGFTVDRILDLACHETYPGHHTINALLDPRVQPLFSPQSLRTEGAASYASALAFPFERRLPFERDVLMPLAGLDSREAEMYLHVTALVDTLRRLQADIARRYLDGRLEFARAARALEAETLMSPPAAESMLKFLNEFRTYVITYTVGRDLVRDRVQAAPDEAARWQAYERWFRS
jgi:hypothetical protein